MHRFLFLILLSLVILLNCQPSKPISADTLVVGIDTYPEQLDPRRATDANSSKINKLIYNGLLVNDIHQNLVGDLAQEVITPDSQTYEFILKDNVVFHNHKKLTSADVQSTYLSMLDPAVGSPFRQSLQIIDHIQTPDANRVIFKLKKPYTPFLSLMTLAILPQGQGSQIIGSGPYKIVQQPEGKDNLFLTRNDEYYGAKPKIKTLQFRIIQDATLRSLELMKGRLDLVQNNIPFVMIPFLQRQAKLKLESDTGINFAYMAFNFKNEYLKNQKVRQAISLAINRNQLIQYKLAGLAQKASSLLNPNHWAFNNQLPTPGFDLAAAKKLLDETPFNDPDGDGPKKRFKLIYKTSNVKERIEIAQLIAENLQKIGIDVEIKSYEFGTFYRDIKQGNFDIFTLTWVGLTDPDIYYLAFHSSQIPPNGANRGFYENPKLDRILDQARVESDFEKRKMFYQSAQEIVFDDYVYAPLWYESNFVFMRDVVHGYELRPDASYLNFVNVEK